MSGDVTSAVEQARASLGGSNAAPGASTAEQRLALQRVAQQFEGMLLSQMLREMRKAGEASADHADGDAQMIGLGNETFTEAIDAELGVHLARAGGIGLTTQLMTAFDRLTSSTSADAASATVASMTNTSLPAPVAAGMSPVAGVATPTGSSPVTRLVSHTESSPGSLSSGDVAHEAKVTSPFGWRSDPFTGRAKFHKGIDLRAAYGEEVHAAGGGTVVFSGEQGSYGTTVVIQHPDGSRSRYAHLSATTIEAGSRVEAGQSIGRAGRSGRATGTHVHFEVTGPDGRPVSPDGWSDVL